MIQEFVIDGSEGDRVERAFQAAVARHSELICVDSGANILILRFLLSCYSNYRASNNRFIQTASEAQESSDKKSQIWSH